MPYGEGQTLDNMLGSLFIGSVLAAVYVELVFFRSGSTDPTRRLYGVTSLQSYWYYHWFYKRDATVHRIAVRRYILSVLPASLTPENY